MKRFKDLTIADVEKAIGIPAKEWHGNCFFIATQIVEKKLVKGRAVYGHYRGPVSPTGWWKHRIGQAFLRHGWVELPDGMILDPTRWSFEDKPPYIYLHDCVGHDIICKTCDMVPEEHGQHEDACLMFQPQICDYDAGGEDFRTALMRPPPPYRHIPTGPDKYAINQTKHIRLKLTKGTLAFLKGLLGGTPELTWEQVHWIANLPLKMFDGREKEVFKAIVKAGEGVLIPTDNRTAVLGDR